MYLNFSLQLATANPIEAKSRHDQVKVAIVKDDEKPEEKTRETITDVLDGEETDVVDEFPAVDTESDVKAIFILPKFDEIKDSTVQTNSTVSDEGFFRMILNWFGGDSKQEQVQEQETKAEDAEGFFSKTINWVKSWFS